MKLIKVLFATAFVGLIIAACTKDKIVPTAAQNNATLLAGASGSSKTWKMTAASYSQNGGAAQPIPLGSCLSDNVYKFTNNASQDFTQTEGAIKCNSADSTVTETGNWTFTNDGKNLVVLGSWYDDLSTENEFLLPLTALGVEAAISALTDSTLVITFSFSGNNTTTSYTVTFSKIS